MLSSPNTDLSDYLDCLGFGATAYSSSASSTLAKSELGALERVVSTCTLCPLHATRQNTVFGSGHQNARIMFVGEGPGADEDASGEPFVGRAGQLLTKMIEAMKMSRGDVYICNVVKCRPPQNRNPEPGEIASCLGYLREQIKLIDPQIIVALGAVAAKTLLNTEAPISSLRGSFHQSAETLGPKRYSVLPTFHPAYLLRNPEMKKEAWEDLQKVMLSLSS
jgi:uracil-DNA glycosylase family 4